MNTEVELQKLVDSIPVGIGIYRVYQDGRLELVYLNEGYYLMLGTTKAQRQRYLGFSVFEAIHPEDYPQVMREVAACIREDRPLDAELRVRTESGTYKWFSIRASIMERAEDSTLLYCAYSDIDELKRAKLLLERERSKRLESETRLQSIMENVPGAVVSFEIKDGDICMTYISEGCQRITGFTAAETCERLGHDALADVHPDDRAECHRRAVAAIRKGTAFNSVQRVQTKEGAYVWVSLTLSPVIRDNTTHYYGIYLDISEEHEKQLMLDQLVDCLPGGVAIFKFEGLTQKIQTLYYSEGLEKIAGNAPEEIAAKLSGNILRNSVYEDDLPNVEKTLREALSAGAPFSTTYRLKCMGNELVWVQAYGRKIRDEDAGQIYYTIFTKPTQESFLYQSLVEDAANAVLVVDMEYRKIVFANTLWKKFCHIPPDRRIIGEELATALHPKDIMISAEMMHTLPADRYKELHEINAHGRHLCVYARKLRWNGRAAYVCFAVDETELQESKTRLQQLIDMVPGGIAIYDIGADSISLDYINNAYAKMLGDVEKTRSEFLGANTINAVYPADRHIIHETAQKIRAGEDSVDAQFRVPNAEGQYIWVRMTGAVVRRNGGHAQLYSNYSDCDEIVKAQQELISNRVMLDEALKITKVMVWKYDRTQHAITDTGTLGIAYHLPKRLDNVPQVLLDAHFVPEEDERPFRELFDRLDTELQASVTVKGLAMDGSEYRMFKLIYTSVLDEKGNYLETIGTSIDVTEQIEREKNYEEQLHLKELTANKAVAVAHFNLTKNSVSAIESQKSEIHALLHTGTADQVFATMRQMLPVRQRGLFDEIESCEKCLQMFAHGQTHFSVRHQLENDPAWYESRFDLLENPYTGDIEAIHVVDDVTYEVRAEQVVSVLMKVDYESVLTLDANTGAPAPFVHNELAEDMVGVFREQKAAKDHVAGVTNYLRKYCADTDIERVIRETSLPYVKQVLARQPIHTSVYTLKLNGKRIHKRAIYAYLDESRRILLCAIQDITETYRQEEIRQQELAAALQEAREANRKKTDFFSQMSHDLRTPMNGILGLAELSADENDPARLKADMKKIKVSGEYLLSLINDTLDFQRIESGKMTIEPTIVEAEAFLENVIDMVKPTAGAKHIAFKVENHGVDLHRCVRMDAVRMKQILVNLLSNAIKFTPENGEVRLDFTCTGHTAQSSHLVVLVQDTGIGMSREFLEHGIFLPFSQEYNAITAQYAGSGLGLSIVHRLVQLMGGSITVESEQGVGTTFTIHMDFELVDTSDAGAVSAGDLGARQNAKKLLNGKRILLVEDHPLNAEIASRLLEKVGCQVSWATNGEKGVAMFAQSQPNSVDAILMDIRMPVMDGLQAARTIRGLQRGDAATVPIIAMTANAYEDDVRQALAAGMNAHLAKPIDPVKLYQALQIQLGAPPAGLKR